MSDDERARVRLPDEHRGAFRAPLGPIYTDVEPMLDGAGEPVIAIGDMVAYHLSAAGAVPAVAVIDGRTKREAVDPDIEDRLADVPAETITAANPAGTITASLVVALQEAIDLDSPVQVVVSGEEDLATIPAIALAPDGATVVYGQPDEGMVRVDVTADARARAKELFSLMTGDVDRIRAMFPRGN